MALKLQKQQQDHVGEGASGGYVRSYVPLSGALGDLSSSSLAGFHRAVPVTLDLFQSKLASSQIELDTPAPLSLGWQKFLDLKTGEIYYKKDTTKVCFEEANMSRNGKNPKLDLKLNLSPPRVNPPVLESSNQSASLSPTSPPSSCVSSEETLRHSNSPEATSMVLAGCQNCLMYVMLSEEDPKCPKCKSTVLLDFLHDNNTNKTRKS
ncbi:hypothetical protein HHK36_019387 [Tetracentron sinense]|uniref:GIR1-like zinc ribbon domain-containing protein n=1 Tax=Tetracentron sinense TaxID=13715 RepID=A0A834YZ49_TETSI|nr:hypothetical protein HHK36_019387 [Tetracentron sinense]